MYETCSMCRQFRVICMCKTEPLNADFARIQKAESTGQSFGWNSGAFLGGGGQITLCVVGSVSAWPHYIQQYVH